MISSAVMLDLPPSAETCLGLDTSARAGLAAMQQHSVHADICQFGGRRHARFHCHQSG